MTKRTTRPNSRPHRSSLAGNAGVRRHATGARGGGIAVLAALAGAALAQTPVQPRLPPDLPAPRMLPDLVVSRIDFVDGVFYEGPCNRVAITIRNSGFAAARAPIPVMLSIAIPVAEAARTINMQYPFGLDPGASGTVFVDPFDLTSLARNGSVEIRASVDGSDAILETNNGNNTTQVPMAVLAAGSNCPVVRLIPGVGIEGAPVPFGVHVDRSFPRQLEVNWRTQQGAAIAGGQCGGPADFVGGSGTQVFPANTTNLQRTVFIPTCRDALREIDEPLSLQVTGSRNVKLPAAASVTGIVRDNQAPP